MEYTETQIINAKIARASTQGATKEQFITQLIKEYETSAAYEEMKEGCAYFANRNPKIVAKKRLSISNNGEMVEDKTLSNNRIAHPFMRKLTRQKVNYLLAKPFSIETDDKALQEAIESFLNKKFFRLLRNVGYGAIQEGIQWLRAYYNQDGELSFLRAHGLQIIPLWADLEHTSLEALVYTYFIEDYGEKSKKLIRKVEYHDENGSNYYTEYDGKLIPDADRKDDTFNFTIDGKPYLWERIPFVPFRYNSDEVPLIRFIRAMIDSYDWTSSTVGDLLDDIPTLIYVLKAAVGTDLSEFRQNMMQYKAVKVAADGGLDTLNPEINIDAAEKHLDRLRRDIFDAGDGVDTQSLNTSNISTDTFRMLYNGLDMDCQGMGAEFAASLEQLLWFIFFDIRLKTGQDFFDTQYEIIWNTDVSVNESETIDNIVKLKGIVSDELLDEQNPWVKDAAVERARREKQEQDEIEKSVRFGFPVDNSKEADTG